MKLIESLKYQPNELGFGTSGLRGLVSDMTDLECYINTLGFLQFTTHADSFKTVYVSGDLRSSTPRILKVVTQAIKDSGYDYEYCGLIPTPALALYAARNHSPCIMVTGSHIPDDRNGIKFYKQSSEVLKSDEASIQKEVASIRQKLYEGDHKESPFDAHGAYTYTLPQLVESKKAQELYLKRYVDYFGTFLSGHKIVLYQHSAVGRDIMATLLEALGAEVVCEGRSNTFIPIDTENVTPSDEEYFKELAVKHHDVFAILSTDGDGDRPFLIDESGTFHRGDVIGVYTAQYLGVSGVALPISSNDAAESYLGEHNIEVVKTRIGSPYVIEAMQQLGTGHNRVAGWEVNGGFLLGSDIDGLSALPTRDAILPQLACIATALNKKLSLSQLFAQLPKRYTQAGLIDNFPVEVSKKLIKILSQSDQKAQDTISSVFRDDDKIGELTDIDSTDGVRMYFSSKDIIHIRPSGNAPQLRVYTNTDSQQRADALVAQAVAEPNGFLRQFERLAC